MSVPTGPAQTASPMTSPWLSGAFHQIVVAPAQVTFAPTHFNPVPVASALKGGFTGIAYSETITAQRGTSPYTFAVTSGALPTGCSMSSAGLITGTPTVIAAFGFTVTVTDSLGSTGSQAFTISIAAPSGGGGAYLFTT